ncbi:MAG: hypothetical protein V3V78_04200 [Candidatus Woesearchaeota archaeon]
MKNIYQTIKNYAGKTAAACGLASVLFFGGCGDSTGGSDGSGPRNPTAIFQVMPNEGGKSLEAILDGSSSIPTDPIIEVRFDRDGDGNDDYVESETIAPDGSFDMVTTLTYDTEGDYTARLTVITSAGKSDSTTFPVKVGFGDDIIGAGIHSENVLANLDASYVFTPNQVFQIPDLRDPLMPMHSFTADVKAVGGDIVNVIYNYVDSGGIPTVTEDDKEIIDVMNSETGTKIFVIEEYESPLTIEDKLTNPIPELLMKNPMQHEGVNITSWWWNDYFYIEDTLETLKGLGVEHVSFLTTQYQGTVDSTDISALASKTPSDNALKYAIGKAKEMGFKVTLKPHVDVIDGSYRGDITFSNEADWADWFASYDDFITHYAGLAEDTGVDMLVIGTELDGTSHRSEWKDQIIPSIESEYDGKKTYAASDDDYQSIAWWDDVDYIGVTLYRSLTATNDPTPAELDAEFVNIRSELEAFAQAEGQQIMISEVGFQSYDGTNTSPWWAPTTDVDELEQEMCYEAMYKALHNNPDIRGIYLWMSYHDPSQDVDGFDFIGKPAELTVNFYNHLED